MKLRIARKMDTGRYGSRCKRDKRTWWRVYTNDQLIRAEIRLRKAWSRRNPWHWSKDHKKVRNLDNDWFAANRVHSRQIRQAILLNSRAP